MGGGREARAVCAGVRRGREAGTVAARVRGRWEAGGAVAAGRGRAVSLGRNGVAAGAVIAAVRFRQGDGVAGTEDDRSQLDAAGGEAEAQSAQTWKS